MKFSKKEPIIFIVSGKANSGKDTTCEFIDNYFKLNNYKIINLQFSSYIKNYAKNISDWDGSEINKPRELLQQLGTDIIRKNIDNEFFIKRIIGDIKVYSYYFDAITISDARLPEEIESINNNFKNVIKIRVERPNFKNALTDKENKHLTEIALDNYNNYDYVITNSKTLDDLNEKVIEIIKEVM